MSVTHHAPIILASGSTIRQQMLRACGLTFSVEPSGVDEEALSAECKNLGIAEHALTLGRAKALAVAKSHPNAYVIGADQICCLDGEIFSKPGSYDNAEAQLAKLQGKTHQQQVGCVIAHKGKIVWELADAASLTMRPLTAEEIHAYIAADAPLASCGSYKFESLGRHLFSKAEGDHDVIKGLPLLPLLAALHELQVISLGA